MAQELYNGYGSCSEGTGKGISTQGKWYDGAWNAAKDFAAGAAVAGDNNLFFGGAQAITGKTPQSDSTAFKFGKVLGDIGSLFLGEGIITGGGAGEIVGVVFDATGVGAIAGVPLNIASAGAIAYGGTVIVNSAGNLINDGLNLMSGGGGGGNPQYKQPVSGSGKEKATDVPSWAKGNKPYTIENGKDFATRLMDGKYGKGNWKTSSPEYSQIKKWGDRGFN